jgi:hypothetical protein
MRYYISLLAFWGVLLGLAACRPDQPTQTSAAEPAAPTEQSVARAPVPAAQPGYIGYRRYTGRVGTLPVVVELWLGDSCAGRYYYQRRGGEIELKARHFGPDQPLVLLEDGGRWEAAQPAGPRLSGTWRGGKGRSLPFELREDYRGAVRYEVRRFEGQGELCTEEDGSPAEGMRRDTASYDAEYIQLLGPDSLSSAYRQLRKAVGPPAPPARLAAYAAKEVGNSCGYHSEGITVGLNANYLFSYWTNIEDYSFGAAHPNHNCQSATYDLRTGAILELDDLLRPGYELPLRKLITRHLLANTDYQPYFDAGDNSQWQQRDGSMSPYVPLSYCGFLLTPEGVTIIYGGYEIGPYVLGMPMVVLPYAELRSLVQVDGPLTPLVQWVAGTAAGK